MQHRRQYGSSGELDVFGATCYFDGLTNRATGPVAVREPTEDLTLQVKMMYSKNMEESHHAQLGIKAKSKLTAFFGSLVSPEASFRKKPPPAASTLVVDEPPKVSSSSSRGSSDVTAASMQIQGCGHDLGVVMGDRRLQGVRVVRGSGDEERWVVRCSAWEEHHDKMFVAASTRHQVGEEDGDHGWESDSSSDLFELELEDMIFPANY